jgi:hypothetical protein
MTDEDDTTAAIRQVRRATLEAKAQTKQAQFGFGGLDERDMLDVWQTRLFEFMDWIAAYQDTPNAEKLWREPLAPEDGVNHSLADVHRNYFATTTETIEEYDDLRQERRKTQRRRVTTLNKYDLRLLHDQLERIYVALGFEEPPKRGLGQSGPIKETQEHIVEGGHQDAIREVLQQSPE